MSEDSSTARSASANAFSADDVRRRMAASEASRAAERERQLKEREEKQKALIAEFHKPPQPQQTPEQLMQMVMLLVSHAADQGQSEVQVYRFPSALCSDGGRRINNSEDGWAATLEGRSKFAYEFWNEHLQPLGFHLKAQVLDYPNGMPGDIGFFLTWRS